MKTILQNKMFKTGAIIQLVSVLILLFSFLAIILGWIDTVSIGLEGGIDKPSPKLNALYFTIYSCLGTLILGFVLCIFAWIRNKKRPNKENALDSATASPSDL
jgi:uncharacterized BrkB/YihY/UPF0761 family membrane protein